MKALKEFNIEELLKRQATLDKKFDGKKTTKVRTIKGIQVALITEIGELIKVLVKNAICIGGGYFVFAIVDKN